MIKLIYEKCTFCGQCLAYCNFDAIDYDADKKIMALNERCISCGKCVKACPSGALYRDKSVRRRARRDTGPHEGILVWAETEKKDDGVHYKEVVFEIVSEAAVLAKKLQEKLIVAVIGDTIPDYRVFAGYGVDEVYQCTNEFYDTNYSVESFTRALTTVSRMVKPSIILLGATNRGRAVAPRAAAVLHAGITADCTQLEIDDKKNLIQIRPAFGGNIMASIITPETRPQMATIRPNTFKINPAGDASKVPVLKKVAITLQKHDLLTRIIKEVHDAGYTEDIKEADILVSVGKGIGSKDNIAVAEELAAKLGGMISCSRAVVELGWLDHTRQVGQSGKTVSPKLYIALGISGAIQHIAGMSSAEYIIAVNNDPDAPIFKHADYGIIGDLHAVCPELIKALPPRG